MGFFLWLALQDQPPQDPAIPPSGIYLKDAISYHKGMCLTTFTVAVIIIAKKNGNTYCPSTEGIRESIHKENGVIYTVVRKHGIMKSEGKWMK